MPVLSACGMRYLYRWMQLSYFPLHFGVCRPKRPYINFGELVLSASCPVTVPVPDITMISPRTQYSDSRKVHRVQVRPATSANSQSQTRGNSSSISWRPCPGSVAAILPNVDRSGWNLALLCCCTQYYLRVQFDPDRCMGGWRPNENHFVILGLTFTATLVNIQRVTGLRCKPVTVCVADSRYRWKIREAFNAGEARANKTKLGYRWQTARRICAICNGVADP